MDIVTVAQLRPDVFEDAERRARAEALIDAVAQRHSLDPVPHADEVGSITIVGLTVRQVEDALESVDPGWRDEGLFDLSG